MDGAEILRTADFLASKKRRPNTVRGAAEVVGQFTRHVALACRHAGAWHFPNGNVWSEPPTLQNARAGTEWMPETLRNQADYGAGVSCRTQKAGCMRLAAAACGALARQSRWQSSNMRLMGSAPKISRHLRPLKSCGVKD